MAYDEITVKKNNVDGSTGVSTAKIENGEMGFDTSSTPAPSVEVTAADINSESALSGQALLADGQGGASWENIPQYISSISQVVQPAALTTINDGEIYSANVFWIISKELFNRIKQSKFIVFTMNNSFVMTPLAQNGATLTCGSFAYNTSGDTMVARLRIALTYDEYTQEYHLVVHFDNNFAHLAYDADIHPYALFLIAE